MCSIGSLLNYIFKFILLFPSLQWGFNITRTVSQDFWPSFFHDSNPFGPVVHMYVCIFAYCSNLVEILPYANKDFTLSMILWGQNDYCNFSKVFSLLSRSSFKKFSLDPLIHSLNYFHEEAKGFEDISLLFLNIKSCRCQCHRGVFFMTSRSHSCFFDQLAVKGISCWKSKLVKISKMELLSWLSTVQQG